MATSGICVYYSISRFFRLATCNMVVMISIWIFYSINCQIHETRYINCVTFKISGYFECKYLNQPVWMNGLEFTCITAPVTWIDLMNGDLMITFWHIIAFKKTFSIFSFCMINFWIFTYISFRIFLTFTEYPYSIFILNYLKLIHLYTIWQVVHLGFHLNWFQWVARRVQSIFKPCPGWSCDSSIRVSCVKTW